MVYMNWIIALIIFILTYAVLFSEKVDRTIVTLAGALSVLLAGIVFGFYSQHEAFLAIDFDTIALVLGMMVMVGTVERTGLIEYLAIYIAKRTEGKIWLAGVLSGIIDNVPLTIALIPVIHSLGSIHGIHLNSYWWALALGAVLGGISSPVGSSANVISVSLSERTDTPITFTKWIKVGLPLTLVNLTLASLFLFFGMRLELM